MKLHPALRAWFDGRYQDFSPIQKKALRFTLSRRNTLILAPTGSGKTLAAFLSILSDLASLAERGKLGNSVRTVYVSPLKALGRDIYRNLTEPLEALNRSLPPASQIRMDVRTGDTSFAERGRQQRKHPHLLLTTPESLSAILCQTHWRGEGFLPRTVVVDEIHALAENKRGSLLSLALERLEARSEAGLQRIGLSATAWPIEAVSNFLVGGRPCEVARVDLRKTHELTIADLPEDLALPPAGYNPERIAYLVAEQVARANCSLIFTTTRSGAERLGLALKILLPEEEARIEVHHGSIDKENRLHIEARLAEGSLKAVVCSTSLELGVDFAHVDQVLLIGAPRGVSRALQRLGRSGHRINGVARGVLMPLSLPDLLECTALRHTAHDGRLDNLRVPECPLDVLAQTLLSMSIEKEWDLDEAFELIRRAGPYRSLTRADFDSLIEYLSGGGRVLGPYGTYGKIVIQNGRFSVASKKTARSYYMNSGVISDDAQIRVVTRRHRRLGEVEEEFLASLQPGEAFLMGGQPVALKMLYPDIAIVEPAKGERVRVPRWMGGKAPLSAQLAHEETALRRALREAWNCGGQSRCISLLRNEWKVPESAAVRIAGFLARQTAAAPIPVGEPVQVEFIRQKRPLLILFHILAGKAVNRSLAWVLAARLPHAGSIISNSDDHSLLIVVDARKRPSLEELRAAFDPSHWQEDLRKALEKTEMLGRRFRAVAEVGQLLPRKTVRGRVPLKSSVWNGSLLYQTLREYEPDHPLVREAVREALEDQCDSERAWQEAERVFHAPWETYELPHPSPFALPLYAAFNRETLVAQNPDQVIDDLYKKWKL